MELISIIIPCYNQAQFLEETLLSVFNQTYINWECIIVDDGSTDNTDEVAENWVKKDVRFIYTKKINGGLSSARNFGIERAKGQWIQFLDSDDLLSKDKLQKSIESLIENMSYNLIITNFNRILDQKIIEPYCQLESSYFNLDAILNKWDIEFSIPIHCGLFSADFFKEIKFNEQLKAKEDWVFWIEIFSKNVTAKFIDEPLVTYRFHEKSMTQSSVNMTESTMGAIKFLKDKINQNDYHEFLWNRISNYREKNLEWSHKFHQLKKSNLFVVGHKMKLILKKLGLLNVVRRIISTYRN